MSRCSLLRYSEQRHRLFPRHCLWLTLLTIFIGPAVSHASVTPQQVQEAIDKGKAYLLSKQDKEAGRWEADAARKGIEHDWQKEQGDSYGGFTSLCTYALLASGERPNSPQMLKAIDFLKKADICGIYSIGLRCQVWLHIPQHADNSREMRDVLNRDLKLLMDGINQNGTNKGLWDYGDGHGAGKFPKGRIDHSVSQYGVLGLWALEQAGAEVDSRIWTVLDSVWRAHQFPDGGWAYDSIPGGGGDKDKKPPSASMTAAGVATLFILDDMLHGQQGSDCVGGAEDHNIEAGLKWMSTHFNEVKGNYAMYGVERIGVASGYKYFGKVDWYRECAERLVGSQSKDGSWTGGLGGPLADTSFAVLFLSRGKAPVLINKLDYRPTGEEEKPKPAAAAKAGGDYPWDQRPRDCANLAKFLSKETESFYNWQIVSFNVPEEELHEAPILYISGNRALKFSEAEEAKLKKFVQEGGLILGNSNCPTDSAGGPFGKSFRDLGSRLFSGEFRQLETSHIIMTDEQFPASRWKSKPVIYGLSNGVREQMVLLPTDPSRAWQTDSHVTRSDQFQLACDVYEYATDKQPLPKGQTFIIRAVKPAKTTIKVARIMIADNPNPEPAGWTRLDAIMRNEREVGVEPEPVKLGEGKLAGFKVAHLTGTSRFKWNDDQIAELKKFIDAGGTLVIDSAGGATDFADSAEKQLLDLAKALGIEGGEPGGPILSASHPVFARADAAIKDFDYRSYARRKLTMKLNAPRLRGIEIKGRIAVFYSREDLSEGLIGQEVDGILGYAPATATHIMRNILLYASTAAAAPPPDEQGKPATKPKPKQKPKPKPRPATAPAPA